MRPVHFPLVLLVAVAACGGAAAGAASGVSSSGSTSGPIGTSGGASGGNSGQSSGGTGGSLFDGGPLNPAVAPGGNFDLSIWELQEPVGSQGNPTTIGPTQLEGSNGYQDSYFFTDPVDGSMTFWDPEDGVTTANSKYPRSELREMTNAGSEADWAATGTNTLSATLKSSLIPDHVCVGQIHLGTGTPSSTKPLLELFYYSTGDIVLAIEQTPGGGNEIQYPVGNAPLGTLWSYSIGLSGSTLSLSIDEGAVQTFAVSSTFSQENMYFKAGDYDQSNGDAGVGAKVQFYALQIVHAS